MKFYLKLCLNFLTFVLHWARANYDRHDPETHVPLIIKVRKLYSTSSVIFAHPSDKYDDYADLQLTHIIHTCSRILGRKGIMTLNVHFKEMYQLSKYYGMSGQPLIIVMITGPQAFLQFVKATQTFKMSFSTWLVVFFQQSRPQMPNYCHEPPGNPFSLLFNTKMLVVCDDDNILREWYSLDGNSTEIFDLGTWNYDTEEFHLSSNLSLHERRRDLKGKIFRGVIVKNGPFFKITNGMYDGFFGRLVNEFTQALNFTIEIVSQVKEYGSYNKTIEEWGGAMFEMAKGRADIGVSEFSMSSARLDVVDFLIPLLFSRNCLYFKEPDIFSLQWFAYIETFSYSIWLAITGIMVLSLLVLVFIKSHVGFRSKMRVVSDEFLHVWGIFCQQGIAEVPKSLPLRLAYFTIFVSSLVICSAYSASLICFLTACVRILPFYSIEGFLNDGTYKLVVPQGTAEYDFFANSNEPLATSMMKFMKPYNSLPINLENGFLQICNDPKLVLYTSEEGRKSFRDYIPCKVSIVSTGRTDTLSMILPKDSPYTKVLNHHLQKFLDNGILDRFRSAFFSVNFERKITFQPVGMFNVVSLLAISCSGILFAVVVLLIEICYHSHNSKVKFRNAPTSSQSKEIT